MWDKTKNFNVILVREFLMSQEHKYNISLFSDFFRSLKNMFSINNLSSILDNLHFNVQTLFQNYIIKDSNLIEKSSFIRERVFSSAIKAINRNSSSSKCLRPSLMLDIKEELESMNSIEPDDQRSNLTCQIIYQKIILGAKTNKLKIV